MAQPTRELAEFAAAVTYEQIPASAVAHAKLCLLDTLGCGLFGSTLPWTRTLVDVLSRTEGVGPAGVLARDRRLPVPGAVLANGSAVHGFELDDLHQRSILHAGSVVVPPLLALADSGVRLTGADLLRSMIVGYEVGARAGMAVGTAHLLRGFHPTGTHGTVAAAAAAGAALGLDAGAMLHAIGIAGTQAAGLMAAQYSSMVKRFHAGRAAQSGVYAALLAADGYTGITDLFESPYGGYCSTLSPTHDLAVLTADLGAVWEVEAIGFKPYSTNGSCHTTIDALRDLRSTGAFTADQVESITVWVSSATKEHVGWPYTPDSITTAQMNLPYIAAVTLVDGDAFVEQFTDERVRDPALVELAARVEVVADPEIDARGHTHRHAIRLELRLDDGRVLHEQRQYARGGRHLPMSRAEVEDKFRRLAQPVLPADHIGQLRALIDGLESVADSRELSRLVHGRRD